MQWGWAARELALSIRAGWGPRGCPAASFWGSQRSCCLVSPPQLAPVGARGMEEGFSSSPLLLRFLLQAASTAPTASCQGCARFPNPAAAGPGSGALLLAPALTFQAQQGLLESRESRAASDNAAGCGGASPLPLFGRGRRPPGKRRRALPCTSCSPHSTRPYLRESLRLCLLLQFLPSCSPSLLPHSPALAPAQKCLSAAHGLQGQAQPWPPLSLRGPGRRKAAQRFAVKWVQQPWPQPRRSGPRFPSIILP